MKNSVAQVVFAFKEVLWGFNVISVKGPDLICRDASLLVEQHCDVELWALLYVSARCELSGLRGCVDECSSLVGSVNEGRSGCLLSHL